MKISHPAEVSKDNTILDKQGSSNVSRSSMLLAAFAGVLACAAEQAEAQSKVDYGWLGCLTATNSDC